MVEGQVQAYKMNEENRLESLDELKNKDYLPEKPQCPDGRKLSLNDEGEIEVEGESENP